MADVKRVMHRAIRRSEYFLIVNAIVEVYQNGKHVCVWVCVKLLSVFVNRCLILGGTFSITVMIPRPYIP